MRKSKLVSGSEILHRSLLWKEFVNYIESLYFPGAIDTLDGSLIAFEFENHKSFNLN